MAKKKNHKAISTRLHKPDDVLVHCEGCSEDCNSCGSCRRCLGIACQICGGKGTIPKSVLVSLPENFTSLLASPTIHVKVGASPSQQREYYLHRAVMIQHSPYFAGALAFPGIELSANMIVLEEPVDDVDAFDMVVEFIYFNDYEPPTHYEQRTVCLLHVRIYLLAERLCMDTLKELALENALKAFTTAYTSGFTVTLPVNNIVAIVNEVYEFTANRHALPPLSPAPVPTAENKKASKAMNGEDEALDAGTVGTDSVFGSAAEETGKEDKCKTFSFGGVGRVTPFDTSNEFTFDSVFSEKPLPTETSEPQPPRDMMRFMVARYCASGLEKYKTDKRFMELVRHWGEFAEDLLQELPRGPKLQVRDLRISSLKSEEKVNNDMWL